MIRGVVGMHGQVGGDAAHHHVAFPVVLAVVGRHVDPVGELQVNAPAVVAEDVLFEDPVEVLEPVLGRRIAEQGDAGTVVADALVAARDGVACRTGEDDARVPFLGRVGA